jgi:hypothetical protein
VEALTKDQIKFYYNREIRLVAEFGGLI